MPRAKTAPAKRRSLRAAPKCADDAMLEVLKRMHLPQIEAAGFLDALVLVGHGMTELGRDDAGAVLTLAEAARERLRLIDESHIDLIQASRGGDRAH